MVEQNELLRFFLSNGFNVLAEARFGDAPVRDGIIVFLTVAGVFRPPPIAFEGGVAFQVKGFL